MRMCDVEVNILKNIKDPNLRQLIEIIRLQQSDLKRTISKNLEKKGMQVKEDIGYVYAQGDLPILLVAHLDTYTNQLPKTLEYDSYFEEIYGHKEAIGGDDRCGVYAILKILEELKPHVLFTVGEELGGLGAIMASRQLEPPDVKYIMELDRSGYRNCVFYNCGNIQFREYFNSLGFITQKGTASDISILGPAWDIAAVNLSICYYNEHTVSELISYYHLKHTIEVLKMIIKKCVDVPYFTYENTFESSKMSQYIDWDDDKLLKFLTGYTMMTDCGYNWKKPKQIKK